MAIWIFILTFTICNIGTISLLLFIRKHNQVSIIIQSFVLVLCISITLFFSSFLPIMTAPGHRIQEVALFSLSLSILIFILGAPIAVIIWPMLDKKIRKEKK